MTNHSVYETTGMGVNDVIKEELKTNPDIAVGDTIHYVSSNQEEQKWYKVILNKRGKRDVEFFKDYDDVMNEMEMEAENSDKVEGGKPTRRTKKRKSANKKNKRRKSIKKRTYKIK